MPSAPDLLPSSPSSLSDKLRRRINELRARIVRTNYNTKFVQTSPELADFRQVTVGVVDEMDEDVLSDKFRRTVKITTYEAYEPFIAKLLKRPCKMSAVVDLLAPGLPDFLVGSSSTSGGHWKSFPKYNYLPTIRSPDTSFDPLRRRATAYIYWLGCATVDIEGDDLSTARMYSCVSSAILQRMQCHLDPEKDEEKMGTFILDHAAPYAAGFISKWRPFLLIHALFAIGSKTLEKMSMIFINTFVDMIRHLDTEFDMMVDCIANGTIPDLDRINHVRHYLEPNMSPDPERAVELRRLGRPSARPGWCRDAWPNLRSVNATSSGSFSTAVPLARWYLGSNIEIYARRYSCSEARIGLPYDLLIPNQFKLRIQDVIEFLDINQQDATAETLIQPWEVERGRRYEPVVTTHDGLWRYRLGDVIEISGFDPTDGVPVLQFVERRNVVMRFSYVMIAETELRAVAEALSPSVLANVVNWTTMIDDRKLPPTIGFFVELVSDRVSTNDLALAPQHVVDALLRSNDNIGYAIAHDLFHKPTIRLVRSGTFSDFMQLKLDEGSNNVGQNKVPIVLPKTTYVTWFSNRVVEEL